MRPRALGNVAAKLPIRDERFEGLAPRSGVIISKPPRLAMLHAVDVRRNGAVDPGNAEGAIVEKLQVRFAAREYALFERRERDVPLQPIEHPADEALVLVRSSLVEHLDWQPVERSKQRLIADGADDL